MPPTRKPIPAREVVRQHVPRFAYTEIQIPNALHTHYRNVNVTLSAGLFTFQRCTEAPYCCFVTFWNVIHRDIRMTPTMLWGRIQCVDNQHYCDHGTTIAEWMFSMSLYDPPPHAGTSWTQHVLDPPNDVPQPVLAPCHCLLIKDMSAISATCGILPLLNPPSWILFEPCARSGARWRIFHTWTSLVTQLRLGLKEAQSLGLLTIDSVDLNIPRDQSWR